MTRKKLTALMGVTGTLILLALVFFTFSANAATTPQQRGPANQIAYVQSPQGMLAPAATTNNLVYHGGPVQTGTNTVYIIYWGAYPASDASIIQSFFQKVGNTPFWNINSQYTDGSGNHPANSAVLAGVWTDSSRSPANIVDGDVQNEVRRGMSANGWTAAQNKTFFVFMPDGTNVCLGTACSYSNFCGYHSNTSTNSGTAYYSAMPYLGSHLSNCGNSNSPNHNAAADSIVSVASHEMEETATDPMGSAWYDNSTNQYENGDKCAWNFGPVDSTGADVYLNGQGFHIQQNWSNAQGGCSLAYGSVAPTPTPSGATLKYEAEKLTSTTNGPANTVSNDTNCSGGVCMVFQATAVGNVVTYNVQVPAARTYDVRIGVKKLNNKGIFQFASNGVNHGSPVDLYSASASFPLIDIGSVTFNTSGAKSFTFTVTGKNSASTGYTIGIDYIELIPQ